MGDLSRDFSLSEFVGASRGPAGKGTLQLTPQEVNQARWWATRVLQPLRDATGRAVRITSYVRTVELHGPRRGQVETGAHGRPGQGTISPLYGNGLDIVVAGMSSAQAARLIWERHRAWGAPPLFAVLDGGDHVHLTLDRPSWGAVAGLGAEYRKPDGTTGVRPQGGGGGSSPAPPLPGGDLARPPKVAVLAVAVVLAVVALVLIVLD